jgi:DNA-binding beta-propeller fold protein YncE
MTLISLSAAALLLVLSVKQTRGQGCSNVCPPLNFGAVVPSLCEGDLASDFADITKTYTICHPTDGATFSFDNDFRGKITVLSNFYIGCNAGRRESGVFAHVAQRYYDEYGDRINFITSLKGGSTCAQWANLYQNDATVLYPDSNVVPKEMPLTVLDQDYELRDDFFTTPFGHPSYVILDGDLIVRHKFVGPCCGYESFFDCTADIAKSLDTTLSGYLDELLAEQPAPEVPDITPTMEPEVPSDGNETDVFDGACTVGDFSDWSACSVACGPTPGIQFRYRSVQAPTALLDAPVCPAPVETRSCTAPLALCGDEETGCVQEFGSSYTVETVASGFDGPRDVAFHPTPGYHLGSYSEGRSFDPSVGEEAWVVNGMNHSVSIVASVGDGEKQTTISRRDRGYYHYLSNATALAFNTVGDSSRSSDRDSFNYWAVCNDDRNTYLGTKEQNNFMGPTLYNSDPKNRNLVNRLGEECGDAEECFFLHSDMLHESPACIGIAHDPETTTAYGNVYWAFDSTGNQVTGQLVRFDFQQPHGPGSMDHAVASVRRFPNIELERGPEGVHAGMVVHPVTRELFVAVPGANKIIAVHTDSGTFARTAREEYPIFSNALPSFEYSIWECPEQRDFATDIQMPTGLALNAEGDRLFVAEHMTGDILVFEVSSGALLYRINTGFTSIGGMALSPKSKALYFVDEETNTLNVVKMNAECAAPFQSRTSLYFLSSIEQAATDVGNVSLFRDYACVADPIVPDAAFFDQVHLETGYASDNPDVQSMAGMDETAALLANRTDCGYTSDLNFDALLLGGFFCHMCLPGEQGAECDFGGTCTNVQWQGYVCDNEFLVVFDDQSGELMLQTPEKNPIDPVDIVLKDGVTYRFTVKSNMEVCVVNGNGSAFGNIPGNDSGCASRGPLLIPIAISEMKDSIILQHSQTGTRMELMLDSEGSNADPINEATEGDSKNSSTASVGLIVGVSIAVAAVLLAALFVVVVRRRRMESQGESGSEHKVILEEAGTVSDLEGRASNEEGSK